MPSWSARGWLSPSTPASACCGCPSTPPTSTTPSSGSGACSRMRSRPTVCTAASRCWSARPSASSLPVTSKPHIRSPWPLRHSPRLLEKHAFSSPTCLEALVDPDTRGDPMSPLRWTCKSTRQLATALNQAGHRVGARTVAALLHAARYSLQANAKVLEGTQHPDRNAQFQYLNEQVKQFLAAGQPVVCMDAKKKELVGDFKNGGCEWQPQGWPERVHVHDFPDPHLGKAIPYGIYDVGRNAGWVTVGQDHDTASFAVATLRRWWQA